MVGADSSQDSGQEAAQAGQGDAEVAHQEDEEVPWVRVGHREARRLRTYEVSVLRFHLEAGEVDVDRC